MCTCVPRAPTCPDLPWRGHGCALTPSLSAGAVLAKVLTEEHEVAPVLLLHLGKAEQGRALTRVSRAALGEARVHAGWWEWQEAAEVSSRPRTAAKAGSGAAWGGGGDGDSHDGLMTSVSLGVRARVGGPGAHDRLVRGIGGEPLGAEAGELLEQRARRARAGLQRFQRGERPLLAPLAALRVEQQLGVGRGWWRCFRRRPRRRFFLRWTGTGDPRSPPPRSHPSSSVSGAVILSSSRWARTTRFRTRVK